nr:sulfur transferase domain-containing protein [Acidovorax sp. 106]
MARLQNGGEQSPGRRGRPHPAACADLARAAQAAGLQYVYLPVVGGAITAEQAQAMGELLHTMPAPVLAFCRSGARSAQLFSLAQAGR